ncbi:LysR substrate-binding domain-containing protein [Amycolatopsis taiwanensis]|uniref:LysR family transcriptional regulator n=1 Tax=Amycolatopsis taiwanensis TaxID=342230 RepID=A0A9W6VAL7_9PSEU|nr:LysR substrate-binding domain-containing protein [Amycolatopsis taiwanensis]GLY63923.1 LysR family transcriptional regulator [Amycolatopsis taiwanensis]
MELRHLRYFTAVAETCHFSRAAERLRVAQPALSQAIRQLEADLGTPLFERTTRQVALTPAGEFFLAEARRILDSVDAGVRGVRRIADGRLGLVRLGLTGTAAYSHLPRIARALKQELPGIALEIHADLLTPAQCDRLRDGTLDLGLLRPPAVGDGIELRTLETERLSLALPAGHPLAAERIVPITRLKGEDFIMYAAPRSTVNEAVVRGCHAAGFVPHRAHTAQGTAVLLALVAAGLGLALVPAGVRAVPLAGVVFRDLLDTISIDLALAWRGDDRNPAVAAVVAAIEAGLLADDLAKGLA